MEIVKKKLIETFLEQNSLVVDDLKVVPEIRLSNFLNSDGFVMRHEIFHISTYGYIPIEFYYDLKKNNKDLHIIKLGIGTNIEYRNKGVMTHFLNVFEKFIKEHSNENILLCAACASDISAKIFRKNGYEEHFGERYPLFSKVVISDYCLKKSRKNKP